MKQTKLVLKKSPGFLQKKPLELGDYGTTEEAQTELAKKTLCYSYAMYGKSRGASTCLGDCLGAEFAEIGDGEEVAAEVKYKSLRERTWRRDEDDDDGDEEEEGEEESSVCAAEGTVSHGTMNC